MIHCMHISRNGMRCIRTAARVCIVCFFVICRTRTTRRGPSMYVLAAIWILTWCPSCSSFWFTFVDSDSVFLSHCHHVAASASASASATVYTKPKIRRYRMAMSRVCHSAENYTATLILILLILFSINTRWDVIGLLSAMIHSLYNYNNTILYCYWNKLNNKITPPLFTLLWYNMKWGRCEIINTTPLYKMIYVRWKVAAVKESLRVTFYEDKSLLALRALGLVKRSETMVYCCVSSFYVNVWAKFNWALNSTLSLFLFLSFPVQWKMLQPG